MNYNSDKRSKPEAIFKSKTLTSSAEKKTDIYDVINSEDLDQLYKKNAQLLSCLSSTGRQNGILQTEIHSLLEEKSKLDVKNNFLKTKVNSLKDQISTFARQQSKFNQQSLRLKKELKELKVNGFKLIDERTDIIKNQSTSQKLIQYMNYRKKVKKAHKQIKERIREIESHLLDLSTKKNINNSEQIKSLIQEKEDKTLMLAKREIVYINQIKNLEKRYRESQKIQSDQEVNINKLKSFIESENKNQISSKKEREANLHDLIQILKHQQENFLKENESYKNQLANYNLYKQENQTLKDQKENLLKENKSYENQVALYQSYQQENQTLSENYNNLRRIVSQQEEGFKQSLMSFRKRYMKSYKGEKLKSKQAEIKSAEVLRFKILLEQSQKNFKIEKENLKRMLNSEKEKEIKALLTQLDAKNNQTQDAMQNLQKLKIEHNKNLSKLQNEYLEEIQSLKLKLELQSSHFKEEQERAIQSTKNEYESRISGLDISYKKRLQHIRTEMENDLLSERRRSEVFKSMKEKQMEEMEKNLKQLQTETHKLKTSNFALENSNREIVSQLKKEISKNEYLVEQNKNLHNLWHQIQQSLEKKEQQIQSLQKLNKNLSVSFNEMNSENIQKSVKTNFIKIREQSPAQQLKFVSSDEKNLTEKSSPTNRHILADIHFD